ncbi:MAG TPA: mandelate racemase, partial [bacterium]|nr:mandelate racemase [bacterium]
MKIVGVEIIPLTFEWKRVIEESFGTVGKREHDVVVKIVTDDGVSGLGEAMTLGPFYSGESQGTVTAIIAEEFAPKILLGENPFNIDKIHFLMDKFCSGHSIAKTAVDEALYDIMG